MSAGRENYAGPNLPGRFADSLQATFVWCRSIWCRSTGSGQKLLCRCGRSTKMLHSHQKHRPHALEIGSACSAPFVCIQQLLRRKLCTRSPLLGNMMRPLLLLGRDWTPEQRAAWQTPDFLSHCGGCTCRLPQPGGLAGVATHRLPLASRSRESWGPGCLDLKARD